MRKKKFIPIIGFFMCLVLISVPALADSVTFNRFTLEYDSDVATYNGVYVTDLYSNGAIDTVFQGMELYKWTGVAHWEFKPKFYYTPANTFPRTRYLNGLVTFEYSTELLNMAGGIYQFSGSGYEPQFLISSDTSEYMQVASYIKPDGHSVVFNLYFFNYPVSNLSGPTYIECPSVSVSQGFEILTLKDASLELQSLEVSVTQGIINYSANAISLSNTPDTSKGLADIITQSVVTGILTAGQSGDTLTIISLLNSMLAMNDQFFIQTSSSLTQMIQQNDFMASILADILNGNERFHGEFYARSEVLLGSVLNIESMLSSYFNHTDPAISSVASSIVDVFHGGISAMDDLSKPNIQGVLSDISASQASLEGSDIELFYYAYSPRILLLLVITISLALLGYVLYGKGG